MPKPTLARRFRFSIRQASADQMMNYFGRYLLDFRRHRQGGRSVRESLNRDGYWSSSAAAEMSTTNWAQELRDAFPEAWERFAGERGSSLRG